MNIQYSDLDNNSRNSFTGIIRLSSPQSSKDLKSGLEKQHCPIPGTQAALVSGMCVYHIGRGRATRKDWLGLALRRTDTLYAAVITARGRLIDHLTPQLTADVWSMLGQRVLHLVRLRGLDLSSCRLTSRAPAVAMLIGLHARWSARKGGLATLRAIAASHFSRAPPCLHLPPSILRRDGGKGRQGSKE